MGITGPCTLTVLVAVCCDVCGVGWLDGLGGCGCSGQDVCWVLRVYRLVLPSLAVDGCSHRILEDLGRGHPRHLCRRSWSFGVSGNEPELENQVSHLLQLFGVALSLILDLWYLDFELMIPLGGANWCGYGSCWSYSGSCWVDLVRCECWGYRYKRKKTDTTHDGFWYERFFIIRTAAYQHVEWRVSTCGRVDYVRSSLLSGDW